ncbi:retrotransposon protein, putative, ty1-copia subclass [Tanacetum coccineum]|uniref:Retrotransposon protein, putative, ty1-copia subclass n=1 Tax=Tanacetum coccineum TaxID=301880 RepID=A0ABQ4Z4H9_9ASTR
MLAISQFPIKVAESMAKMILKEAQWLWMAWIYSWKSLTKETQEEEAEDIDYSINRVLVIVEKVLVELPPNARTVGSKWLFKKKTDMDGAVYIFKARLVTKGFTQTYGVDYEETFSPVADIRAIRILIAIAAYYDYEIWQLDVKTAFLNGYVSKEVYMEQPGGFVNPKYPNHVCKLKRSIYELKQASRQWNKQFDDEIKKFGFTQNRDEPYVYQKTSGSYVAILILYVDDILLMGNNIPMLQDVKSYLGRSFAMKDLGDAAYILGIKIYRDRSKRLIGLCQSAYIKKILKRYYMENSKRRTIKLKLSKSQGEEHWTAVKNILKYLRNTKDMFLVYGDAEYIAAFDASKEAVWIRKFIFGLGIVPTIEEPISMYCDNAGAIAIAKDDGVAKDDNLADPFTKALAFPKHSELTRNIRMLPASSFMDFPINLSLGIPFPNDKSLGKVRWGKLASDTFPNDNPQRQGGPHVFFSQTTSATVAYIP